MEINFFATLRQVVGQKTVEISLPDDSTVSQLLELVVEKFPRLRPELLDESGQLWGHVHLFINGRDAHYLDDMLLTVIKKNDKVDIFPAVGGGNQ